MAGVYVASYTPSGSFPFRLERFDPLTLTLEDTTGLFGYPQAIAVLYANLVPAGGSSISVGRARAWR